ncbi:hypothetical protein SDC9_105564 [bioreactor metagenome]|uniref:Uncharacterized protein n=1 Tax=bioreactor metagenome TaxID=1076179 RepID=A0A645B2F6_9ZZZZ
MAGDAHGDGAAHRHQNMFAGTPDHDQRGNQDFIGGEHQSGDPGHGNQGADLQDFPIGETVHRGDDENQQQPRHFAKKFQYPPLEFIDMADIGKIIIEHGGEASGGHAPDQDAGEKLPAAGMGPEQMGQAAEHRKTPVKKNSSIAMPFGRSQERTEKIHDGSKNPFNIHRKPSEYKNFSGFAREKSPGSESRFG